MLQQEYVKYISNSIIYINSQHFIDIFIHDLSGYYMRYFPLPDTQLISKCSDHRSRLCKSREIDWCLVAAPTRHYRASGNSNLNRHPLVLRREWREESAVTRAT